jgi:ribosome-associated protein YbcJ (S4-like RNA binding protein)
MINSLLNFNRQTIHEILTFELSMQKICALLVPKILTNEQKENRRNVCLDRLECIENDQNVTKVRDLMRSDRRLTVRMISSVLNLNRQTVHEILTFELGMQKICAMLVPKILTNEQNENRRNMCLELLERIENDEKFFKHVITGDETWIFEYDPDTKRQSSEWHMSNSPCPEKGRMSKSKPC